MFFNSSEVEINFNEENFTNGASVKLKNNNIISFEEYADTINDYSVTYSRVGIVHYNPVSGVVTPLTDGKSIENVMVNVSVKSSSVTNKTQSFKVSVTNYIYARSLEINNVNFHYNEEADVYESNVLTLIVGDELLLPIILSPASCNVAPNITALSQNLIVNDGVIRTKNIASENEQVLITLKTGKNQYVYKIVNIKVVIPNNFSIELLNEDNQPLTDVFTNFAGYKLKVNSHKTFSLSELQKVLNTEFLDFYSLQETSISNEFVITFTKADSLYEKIALKHNQYSFVGNREITSNEIALNVYNAMNNFNFHVKFNENTLIESDINTFNLHLINEEFSELAAQENLPYYANFNILSELNTKEFNFSVYVLSGEHFIALNSVVQTEIANVLVNENGNIFVQPTAVGELKIKVIANDYNFYEEILTFHMLEEKVNSITSVVTTTHAITLYLNSTHSDYVDYINLSTFEAAPKYAFHRILEFSVSNENVLNLNLSGGVISALRIGTCELVVKCGNYSKTFYVEVKEYSGYILAQHNSSVARNGETLIVNKESLNNEYFVYFNVYFSNQQISCSGLKYELLNNNNEIIQNSEVVHSLSFIGSRLSFYTLNYDSQKIRYYITYLGLYMEGFVVINVNNPYSNITEVSFEKTEHEFEVNLYDTNEFSNPLVLTTDNPSLPFKQEHLSVTSSNLNVLVDSAGFITILYSVGHKLTEADYATITASAIVNGETVVVSYKLILFYSEPFANITNISFEKSDVEFEINLYYTNEFSNALTIETDNPLLAYDENLIVVNSSNNYVVIDKLGNVTILYNVGHELEESEYVTICVRTTIFGDEVCISYALNITYKEPYSKITGIYFDSPLSELEVNLYYSNSITNVLNVTTNNSLLPYRQEHLTVTSNHESVQVDSVGNVTILYAVGYELESVQFATITASAFINGEIVTISYVIKLFYEINYTPITTLQLSSDNVSLNFESFMENYTVSLFIILNNGANGTYNFNDIAVLSNSTGFETQIVTNELYVTIHEFNSGEITIGLISDTSVYNTLTLSVTNYMNISNESDLYKMVNSSAQFILTESFTVSSSFSSISNFNGKLHGNGKTISGFMVPLFSMLDADAEISNFTYNTGKITTIAGGSNKVTSLCVDNYGIIANVVVNAEFDINYTNAFMLGGVVYSNYGIISNVKLNITCKSNNATNSLLGLFVYENFNTITNSEVLSSSVVSNFFHVSGFAYTHAGVSRNAVISNCTTKFTFENSGKTSRFVSFIYRVQNGATTYTENCKAYVVYNNSGTGISNYGFVASSSGASYINCEVYINYNNYSPITLSFVGSGSNNYISNAGNNIFTNVIFNW